MISKKKVLYVSHSSGFFVSHRLPLALRAREMGYDIAVAAPAGDSMDVLERHRIMWHPLPVKPRGFGLPNEVSTFFALNSLFRELNPDVVHNIAIRPVLLGTLAAKRTGVPRVVNAVSGLGYLFTASRPLAKSAGIAAYRLLMRHPQMRVILQNREDLDFFKKHRMAPPKSLCLVRGSGVDVHKYAPCERPADQSPVIVQTSRMVGDKGVREFVEAACIVKSAFPRARFILVGAPFADNPSTLSESELREVNNQGVVEWVGHQDDVLPWLQLATIYCLPSYREGLPKSLIEAAACGLPLVTTNTTGCKEVVRDGENGLLVPVADAGALADAIRKLIENPALAASLGRQARQSAIDEFALEHVLDQQIGLYSD
jgi:glycosyltransferase involved in cell wall biosynthesis